MGHGGSPDFSFPAFYAGGIPVNGNIGDTDALRDAVFNVDTASRQQYGSLGTQS